MKKIITICALGCLCFSLSAQQLEILASGNSGLFSFSGRSSTRTTSINNVPESYDVFGNSSPHVYAENPYGSRGGISRGLSMSLQRISKRNSIQGIRIGYEKVQSRADIDFVTTYPGMWSGKTAETRDEATGKTNLGFKTIIFSPYIGQRFETTRFTYDLNATLDLVHIVGTYEKAKAIDARDNRYSYSYSSATAPAGFKNSSIVHDVRFGVQLITYYKKIGVTIGYSHGVVNYTPYAGYGMNIANSSLVQFGLSYKLLTKIKV